MTPLERRFSRLPKSPYIEFMGIRIQERHKGRVVMGLQLRKDHLNRFGRLHGGAVAGLVEAAGAGAAFSAVYPDSWCMSMQMNLNFLASVTSGRLVARAKVVHHGSRTLVSDVEVTCNGTPVAKGTVTAMKFPMSGTDLSRQSAKSRGAAR